MSWRLQLLFYRFRHWMFQWKQDNEGDIAFVIFNRLVFIKYKEHTIIRFNGNSSEYSQAAKYVRGE